MIATKSEMLSRRLSQGWNRPISMTKRQRLKKDREMDERMMASQRVHVYLLLLCGCNYTTQKSTYEHKKGG